MTNENATIKVVFATIYSFSVLGCASNTIAENTSETVSQSFVVSGEETPAASDIDAYAAEVRPEGISIGPIYGGRLNASDTIILRRPSTLIEVFCRVDAIPVDPGARVRAKLQVNGSDLVISQYDDQPPLQASTGWTGNANPGTWRFTCVNDNNAANSSQSVLWGYIYD